MNYKDATCNPYRPYRVIDHTAKAILDLLTARGPGVRVPVDDVDAAIMANMKADLRWKLWATKALRNMGYPITCEPHRHLTWYMLGGDADVQEDFRRRTVKEGYSRLITTGRELAGAMVSLPHDPSLPVSLRAVQMAAMALGTDVAVGLTVAEVLADLAVLP